MSTPTPPASPEPSKKPSTPQIIASVAVVVIVLVCAIGYVVSLGDDDEPGGDSTMAEIMCEDFIEERLKAPATAEYEHSTTFTNPAYRVTGTVDSENGFGAMIRSEFTCVVEPKGEDEWELVSLDIE